MASGESFGNDHWPDLGDDDGLPEKCWHTLITTTEYIEGVICLAQSLRLVGSRHPVACWVTDEALLKQVRDFAKSKDLRAVPVLAR
jgi:hypothetical protein